MTDDKEQRRASLEAAIKKLSKSIGDNDLRIHVGKLEQRYSTASVVQDMDRSDRDPKKDIEDIEKAANSLAAAAKQLERVGWHGRKRFPQVLKCFFPDHDAEFAVPKSDKQAKKDLVESLNVMSDILNSAAASINPNAFSVYTAFGDGPEFETINKRKRTEIVAIHVARECASVFHTITGSAPTVITASHERGYPAYGPFLAFVADVFSATHIMASPETWARNAVKDFSPPND
ncbi:hypothetical protein [Ruegeria atlantica]|uniref:Uncharacterized protein n=1 Tax=Ruegeria atlantica TaxID=81569 RepID=A0A0P1E927_9RHOB|nr:hypothetical protein [Ruegeria atlantica]CUH45417.1 hypothetical protein RUM4293_04331 [Ruegeria atlantica]